MTAQELFEEVYRNAIDFGMEAKNDGDRIKNDKGNVIVRKNLPDKSFEKETAYFGFLSPEEDTKGPYSDFSYVIFPDDKDNVSTCIVCLCVGSLGFKNDFYLASHPGLRRNFIKLNHKDAFFKTSFADIETRTPGLITRLKDNTLQNVIKKKIPECAPRGKNRRI